MRGVDAAVRQLGWKVDGLRRRAWRTRGVELDGEFAIDRTAHLTGGVTLGAHCRVRRNVSIVGPRVVIGSWAYVNDGTYIASDVSMGERVAVGQFCRFITGTHDLGGTEHRAGATVIRPIVVGDGVWIGACSTVLPGVTIGRGAVVAAGSVVTRDVEPDSLVAGVPATARKRLDPAGRVPASSR